MVEHFGLPYLTREGRLLIRSTGWINQLQLNGKWSLHCCFRYWILKRHSQCKTDWCRGCFCYSKALNCHDFWPLAGGLELTIITWFQCCPLTVISHADFGFVVVLLEASHKKFLHSCASFMFLILYLFTACFFSHIISTEINI